MNVSGLLVSAGVGVIAGGSLEYVKALFGRKDEQKAAFFASQCATLEAVQEKAVELFTVAQDVHGVRRDTGQPLDPDHDVLLYAAHMAVEVLLTRVDDDEARGLLDDWSSSAYEYGARTPTNAGDESADALVEQFTKANDRIGIVLRAARRSRKP